MLLSVVRRAEGDDLGRRHVLERQLGPGDDLDRRAAAARAGCRLARLRVGFGGSEYPQRGQQSRRARQRKRCVARFDAIRLQRHASGPTGASVEVARRDRRCASAVSDVEPRRALDHDRRSGSAASRSLASFSAAARLPLIISRARWSGSRSSSSSWVVVSTAANGQCPASPAIRTGRPDRSRAIAKRARRIAAQISISQISGTWSEGRCQLRHGSSTSCAFTWPPSSGEHHIWSSRRPRSFLVQSGER